MQQQNTVSSTGWWWRESAAACWDHSEAFVDIELNIIRLSPQDDSP